jgi:CelD/BcsL family acetyltransferase involved in cellulose biosynthesis
MYTVTVHRGWPVCRAALDGIWGEAVGLAFQSREWLDAWFATVGVACGTEAVLAVARVHDTGQLAMALPLALVRDAGLRVLSFPDQGLTDYGAPLLGPSAPTTAADAQRCFQSLLKDLPACDRLDLDKIPQTINGAINPLALLRQAEPIHLSSNVISVGPSWDAWHRGLERTFRKELERSLRVFHRHAGARIEHARNPARALVLFDALAEMQARRSDKFSGAYILDQPHNDAHFRHLVREGVPSGRVMVTALTTTEQIVAALVAFVDGEHCMIFRMGHADGAWRNISPGRLVIEQTMERLHRQGVRHVDLGIGDYPYKRRLGTQVTPLMRVTLARSWRGVPHVAYHNLRELARRQPVLVALKRKLGTVTARADAS